LVTIQNISKGTEIGDTLCSALHKTSHIAFMTTFRSVLYKIMISHDTQNEVPYVFKYVNFFKNLLILHKEL